MRRLQNVPKSNGIACWTSRSGLLTRRLSCNWRCPRIGEIALQGTVPRLSDTPGGIHHLGTTLAAHNEAIYGQELGLTSEEMAALSQAGVI